MEFRFFMPMDPPTATAQEHKIMIRDGRPVFFDPPELKAAKKKLTDHLALHRPEQPLAGPLELVVTWCFPTDLKPLHGMYRTTKPDTDNLNKMFKDCMTHLNFWNDDAQVCREIIEKFWTSREASGIFVRIRQL